ncbi:hypothetical protein [Nocardiopsis sp. B62]|uniref:hypothetical protein n=1 Tax=Nocardiopsis sp. B62 TaxID=2824874 RepID=UPI001B36A738|nr:hypothetical protein [Nocardiopsis sp. B62]MBQ1081587.1 hypothetical protein [Nocardiopsis sp. B62]
MTFLCIDHIEGGGNQHRAELFGDRRIASHRFRSWLRAQGWPPGHQVLCFNCNDGKHFNGGTCPHEEEGR